MGQKQATLPGRKRGRRRRLLTDQTYRETLEALDAQGKTQEEISLLLKVCSRTVARDLKTLDQERQKAAKSPAPGKTCSTGEGKAPGTLRKPDKARIPEDAA